MEPVRVKVYGLTWQTRRRYLIQSILGLGYGVVLLILWFYFWPEMYKNLKRPEAAELPAFMKITVAILNELPWVLLTVAAIKLFEMWIVLRRFTQKEAEQLAKTTETSL